MKNLGKGRKFKKVKQRKFPFKKIGSAGPKGELCANVKLCQKSSHLFNEKDFEQIFKKDFYYCLCSVQVVRW